MEHFFNFNLYFMKKEGLLIDIHKREIYAAIITVSNGKIERIEKSNK